MIHNHFHGAPPSLFAGSAFIPTQIAAEHPSSPAKNRGHQGSLPLTVKQIARAYHSSEDKSTISLDGIDITNVRLVGLLMNKVERATDVSFQLDDGTGRIDINRWINEVPDTNEVAAIQNGMYVKVHCHLRGFQSKKNAFAFSVRPLTDFNEITLHFIECIYVNIEIRKLKGWVPAEVQKLNNMDSSFPHRAKGHQAPLIHQFSAHVGMDGSGSNINNIVLGVFRDPAALSRDIGLHIDEIVRKLGRPKSMIMEAINYLVDVGHIYSTIDECHFKSAYSE